MTGPQIDKDITLRNRSLPRGRAPCRAWACARRSERRLELTRDLARATLRVKTHNILQALETGCSPKATFLAHLCSEIDFVMAYLGRHALTKTLVPVSVEHDHLIGMANKSTEFFDALALQLHICLVHASLV